MVLANLSKYEIMETNSIRYLEIPYHTLMPYGAGHSVNSSITEFPFPNQYPPLADVIINNRCRYSAHSHTMVYNVYGEQA